MTFTAHRLLGELQVIQTTGSVDLVDEVVHRESLTLPVETIVVPEIGGSFHVVRRDASGRFSAPRLVPSKLKVLFVVAPSNDVRISVGLRESGGAPREFAVDHGLLAFSSNGLTCHMTQPRASESGQAILNITPHALREGWRETVTICAIRHAPPQPWDDAPIDLTPLPVVQALQLVIGRPHHWPF